MVGKHVRFVLQALDALSGRRAENETEWQQVATSLAAVDLIRSVRPSAAEAPSLRADFVAWSRARHEFRDIKISESTASKFSEAYLEMLDGPVDGEDGRKLYVLSALSYTHPPEAENGRLPAPMDSDSKIRNKLYARLVQKAWLEAIDRAKQDFEKKLGARGVDPKDDVARIKVLKGIGLGRLNQWVEEDTKKRLEDERRSALSKIEQSKEAHKMWVARKNKLRVRLPRTKGE